MIFIASFKSIKRLNDCCQLAISNGLPDWYTGGRYKKLAPTLKWVRTFKVIQSTGTIDVKDMELLTGTYYEEVLNKLDPHAVYDELMKISEGRNVVLLSQESSDEFSTRLIVKTWFNKAGIECDIIKDFARN